MILDKVRRAVGYTEFNITAIIDIIFILIIFLLFLGQFIASDNYPVVVPEEMTNSITDEGTAPNEVMLSVFPEEGTGDIACIIGKDKLLMSYEEDPSVSLKIMINRALELMPKDSVVNLRMDRNLVYSQYKPIITAISGSNAADLIISGLQDQDTATTDNTSAPAEAGVNLSN